MYLFHFAFCIFSYLLFSEASKLTCNEVTTSTDYAHCKVTFTICKYLRKEMCSEAIRYTKGTNFEGLEKILDWIKFNPRERTAIITNGFQGDPKWMREMGRTWALTEPDVNVILVDWPNYHGDHLQYRKTALLTESVAIKTSRFLEKLNQIYPEQRLHLHFVGHSLGAHVVGQAARILKQKEIIVDRITALDPALPCFEDSSASLRLRKTDAEFVDVIHSNSAPKVMNLGIYERMGHADFYPNGGNNFPECRGTSPFVAHLFNCDNKEEFHLKLYYLVKGVKLAAMKYLVELFADNKKNEEFLENFICNSDGCNHKMAPKLFIESLNPNNPRRFATSVDFPLNVTWFDICQNYLYCNSETCVEMGYGAERREARGAYYVNTAKNYDYENECRIQGL